MALRTTLAILFATILLVHCDTAVTFARQAHADVAQRGGQLVAVDGDTWHVEAVWPEQRRLRVFIYDEQIRPFSGDRANSLSGSVDVSGQRVMFEHNGDVLEARVPSMRLPATFLITIRNGLGREAQVSFTFDDYSVETEPNAFVLPPTAIPDSLKGILQSIRRELTQARDGSQGANLTMAYVPAVHIRDLLLALEPYVATLPPANRQRAEAALLEGVRTAWLLHVSADDGVSTLQIRQSGAFLEDAVTAVLAVFDGASR
jgi:hypothetical protein